SRERSRLFDGVCVEPDAIELRHARLELALETLRPCAETRELGRPAGGTRRRLGLRVPTVVAAQRAVTVKDERDVAVHATQCQAARATVQRRRDAAPVQEKDRLPSPVRDRA